MTSHSERSQWFILLLEFELHELRAYRDEIAVSLESRLKQLGDRVEALEPDRQDEYFDWMYDEIAQVRDSFPQTLRSTVLIALYSLLEDKLFKVCELLGKSAELTLKPSDLRGAGIEQARTYIKRACLHPFPDQSSQWQTIQNFRRIRNCLVHNRGIVEKGDKGKEAKKAIRALNGAGLSERREIRIDESLLNDFTDCIREFFTQLTVKTL